MRWLCLLLAGCVRFQGDTSSDAGSDAGPDAPPPCHDEDNDGVCDTADVCPVDVDPGQVDTDLDNIGDVCDVSTRPIHVGLFSGLVGTTMGFTASGAVIVNPDDVRFSTTNAGLLTVTPYTPEVLVVTGLVDSALDVVLAVSPGNTAQPLCVLGGGTCNGGAGLCLQLSDGTSMFQATIAPDIVRRLTIQFTGTELVCTATVSGGDTTSVSIPSSSGFPMDQVLIEGRSVTVGAVVLYEPGN